MLIPGKTTLNWREFKLKDLTEILSIKTLPNLKASPYIFTMTRIGFKQVIVFFKQWLEVIKQGKGEVVKGKRKA